MATFRMVAPDGSRHEVDSRQSDVIAMHKAGWRRLRTTQLVAPDGTEHEIDIDEKDVSAMRRAGWRTPEPTALRMLPKAGAFVGGLVGGTAGAPTGPGALLSGAGGAALGAAGGEAMRQHIGRAMGVEVPDSPMEAATAMAREGLMGGVEQVGGNVLGAGAKLGGRVAMQAALKATPEVARTALRPVVFATRGWPKPAVIATRGGLKLVEKNIAELGARTRTIVAQNRTRFVADDILDPAERVLRQKLKDDLTPQAFADRRIFSRLSQGFLRRNKGRMRAVDVQKFKQDADLIAKPIWEKLARNELLSPLEWAKLRWYQAMANSAREVLENTTPDAIVAGRKLSLREANRETAEMIALKDQMGPHRRQPGALARIAGHTVGPATGGTVGYFTSGHDPKAALLGMAAGAGAASPAGLSMLAHFLNSPAVAATLAQAPRATGASFTRPYEPEVRP